MMYWEKPKIDWKVSDRFNMSDYNRIKNNIAYLGTIGKEIVRLFDFSDMGEDKTDYSEYWKAYEFNLLESNLETLKENFPASDIGEKKTFFENGPFIDWEELNRIETACLLLYEYITGTSNGRKMLAFTLNGGDF